MFEPEEHFRPGSLLWPERSDEEEGEDMEAWFEEAYELLLNAHCSSGYSPLSAFEQMSADELSFELLNHYKDGYSPEEAIAIMT